MKLMGRSPALQESPPQNKFRPRADLDQDKSVEAIKIYIATMSEKHALWQAWPRCRGDRKEVPTHDGMEKSR
jgi:hypothetical protein